MEDLAAQYGPPTRKQAEQEAIDEKTLSDEYNAIQEARRKKEESLRRLGL